VGSSSAVLVAGLLPALDADHDVVGLDVRGDERIAFDDDRWRVTMPTSTWWRSPRRHAKPWQRSVAHAHTHAHGRGRQRRLRHAQPEIVG
jgi:hypothetical protein